ncbi:SpvB/TcaC N-terminal domain-containing protein [Streptomyces sp. NPDC001928]|uniref:SpvB/TcaC N-terminal domain-containing protein n=1 Tax=Streptomyces sp. NPDC001928 TaxID=3154404 RepID=UPI003325CF8A
MADSGAQPVLSLPQGGGAVQGVGETYGTDLHTGTARASVPLELPAGRAGLQPTLALAYDSAVGDGAFGLGWNLAVPAVRRETAHGVPRFDGTDRFILSGAERLVEVPDGAGVPAGAQRYRPSAEGLFARIVRCRETADGRPADYWDIWSRDGMRSRYGTTPPADAASDRRDPATVCDPSTPGRIAVWHLSETEDPWGNRIEYLYERDPDATGYDQLYLSQIRYAEHNAPDSGFLVRVLLSYEPRPYACSDRRHGFEIRTTRRCTTISTWIGHTDPPQLARTVNLTYTPAAGNATSLLSTVQVTGHDGPRTESLPPLELSYSAFTPQERRHVPLSGTLPERALSEKELELVDLFGDGLPSAVRIDGAVRYWRNLGGGRFAPPRTMDQAPAGLTLGSAGVRLADMTGDGHADLLVLAGGRAEYFPLGSDGRFARGDRVVYRTAPALDLDDPDVRLIDLDGDGATDAVRGTGRRWELYFADRTGTTWSSARTPGSGIPPVRLGDPDVRTADMTGDGLTDIVQVRSGRVTYWPNLGHGRWGPPVVLRSAPRFGTDYDPKRLLLGDVDGDGRADLVYVADGSITVWLNLGGTAFGPGTTVRGTPALQGDGTVRLTDLLGAGTSGVLWSQDMGRRPAASYFFLDLTGGTKPYLLTGIDNHRGSRTEIRYAPSTRYSTADRAAGRPWRTTLPFPVQVVAATITTDVFSGTTLTSAYEYRHGHWDGAEREFRGFARVDQQDTLSGVDGTEHWSPPIQTRTWFHVGPVGPANGAWTELDLRDEFWAPERELMFSVAYDLPAGLPRRALRDAVRAVRGSVLRTEVYADDGDAQRGDRPYTVEAHQYRVTAVHDGHTPGDFASASVFFARSIAQHTARWERGDEPMRRLAWTDGHDTYGRPTIRIEAAVPRGADPAAPSPGGDPYLAAVTRTTWATRDDDARYVTDRLCRETRCQILDAGTSPLTGADGLAAAAIAGTAEEEILACRVICYDGEPFSGLPFGQLGDHGAPTRTEHLVHTRQSLHDVGGIPVYLDPAAPAWPDEYPLAFRTGLLPGAGYTHRAGDDVHPEGWWAYGERQRYGPRGTLLAERDPLGSETTRTYDPYDLLVVEARDAVGNVTSAEPDYRVLMPRRITDPNGNCSIATYSPLGLLTSVAALGRPGQETGDSPEQPGVAHTYGLDAYDSSGPGRRRPLWVRTVRRTEHRWAIVARERTRREHEGLPPPEPAEIDALFEDEERRFPERFVHRVAYFDGLARPLQTREQADDVAIADLSLPAAADSDTGPVVLRRMGADGLPRVVVSGRQTYDNKGRVVEQYEPCFATGWEYRTPAEEDAEDPQAKLVTRYDPLGELVAREYADGSVETIVHGVPADPAQPRGVVPSPWERWTWDRNDNAGRTHPTDSAPWSAHWDTPASVTFDALGRVARGAERLAGRELVTRTRHDLTGNVLDIVDACGRTASRTRYDLLGRPWSVWTLDAGTSLHVLDPRGDVVEFRDAKGALALTAYDELHRPVRRWARDREGPPCTLREEYQYGDTDDAPSDAASRNLLGRLCTAWDEAGRLDHLAYDLAGNLLETTRHIIRTDALLAGLPTDDDWTRTGFTTDWDTTDRDTLLDPEPYTITNRYDALGRRTQILCPTDVTGHRTAIVPRYQPGGGLRSVSVDGVEFVRQILHNARGQRVLAVLGCDVLCRYAYDPVTFRLARLRSEPCAGDPDTGWRATGPVLQDSTYRHDLAGNVLAVLERTPSSGVRPDAPDSLDRLFAYDALYRLVRATGRECDMPPAQPPWQVLASCADRTRARAWTQTYTYDDVGGLRTMRHDAGAGAAWRREHTTQDADNRLLRTQQGSDVCEYAHDPAGNVVRESTSRHLGWDHADRMVTFRVQPEGAAVASQFAQYRYDAAGRRVCRLLRKQDGRHELTVYVSDVFERLALTASSGATTRHDTVHVLDGTRRVARLRLGPQPPDETTPALTYELGDHLDSCAVITDAKGALVDREEFTPYGETCFGGYALKRYRFTGKERDTESGYQYHGARYYVPWAGRWTSCDPAWPVDGTDSYAYVRNNPLTFVDPTGRQAGPSSADVPVNAVATHPTVMVKDPVAGYVERPMPPPTVAPAATEARIPMSAVGQPPDATVTKPAEQPRHRLGIAINESATDKFLGQRYVDADENPGHVIAYVKAPDGGTAVMSYGPSETITMKNLPTFLSGKLPGTANYHLKGSDSYQIYEWPITEGQYNSAVQAIMTIKQDAGMYTPAHQCTSVAEEVGAATSVNLPQGIGKFNAYGMPAGAEEPTPYHLNQELKGRGLIPVVKPGTEFKGLLEVK